MAIAFIPVRDQAKVFRSNSENSANKGTVLKRLSTGKKLSDPKDNPSDYQKVSDMKEKLNIYDEAIKTVSLGISKFEVALSTYKLLSEYYGELSKKLNDLQMAKSTAEKVTNGSGTVDGYVPLSDTDASYYKNSINATIKSIANLIGTKFDSENVVFTAADGTLSVSFSSPVASGGYSPVSVVLGQIASINELGDVNAKVEVGGSDIYVVHKDIYANSSSPTPPEIANDTALTESELRDKYTTAPASGYAKISDLINIVNNQQSQSLSNYKLLMSGVTSLTNIDRLAQVQKTNTTAAISALEDIDVQEEMMELMQAQIFEELSSEALIKIKESSQYITNLIRA